MSLVVGCGVNVHFDQLHSWIIPMIRGPFRGDQYFRVLVVRHVILLLWCLIRVIFVGKEQFTHQSISGDGVERSERVSTAQTLRASYRKRSEERRVGKEC